MNPNIYPFTHVQQVIGREAGALYRIDWMLTTPGLGFDEDKEAVVLRRTPLTFVDSVFELWGALLAGVP